MFLEAVDGGDVLVIELGQEPRFSLETFQAPLVSCECLGEDLDRNIAIELCIACSINLPHTAFPDGLDDFVVVELLTRSKRHGR